MLGIDPGMDGGLVLLERGIERVAVMPTIGARGAKRDMDASAVMRIFSEWAPDHIAIELPLAMPGQSPAVTLKRGEGFGLLRGIAVGMCRAHTAVHPKTWQKAVLVGVPAGESKARAYAMCQRLWPRSDWRASERCKRPHDGLCDAALIAEWCRRVLREG